MAITQKDILVLRVKVTPITFNMNRGELRKGCEFNCRGRPFNCFDFELDNASSGKVSGCWGNPSAPHRRAVPHGTRMMSDRNS